ncbi:MAG: enoyl-CoA hydratase-related protein [Peptococcaceae bacterium]|nr:enoyl-CoA hydratase-related protein [Peptococcaceae bacterium]
MLFENVLLEKDGRVAVLTVNRPQVLNALNRQTLLDIKGAAEQFRDDADADVLVVTGAGEKAFVAGADIAFMAEMKPLEARRFAQLGMEAFRLIEALEKPVIAAINGFALGGGCELAMACDFRVCHEKSKFGQPEVGLGVTPGFGGTQRLPRLVGLGMAKQLLFTGEVINAQEALRIGLVNKVFPVDTLREEVMKMAQAIAKQGQVAVRLCKAAVNEGMQTDIDRAMTLEKDVFGLCFASEDQSEGMKAFMEKRPAQFTGA